MTKHIFTLRPGPWCVVVLLSMVTGLASGCTGKPVDSRGDSDADSDADSDTDTDAAVDSDTGAETPVDYTTAWGSGMIEVAAGTFLMGSGKGDPEGSWTDHEVTLTHDFWLAQAEVTQTQWAEFLEASDPSPSHGDPCADCPVDGVSWVDAALYANALSVVEGLPLCFLEDGSDIAPEFVNSDLTPNPYACRGYRLPTEAEWEYAARAGVDSPRTSGSSPGSPTRAPASNENGFKQTVLARRSAIPRERFHFRTVLARRRHGSSPEDGSPPPSGIRDPDDNGRTDHAS